MSLTRINRQDFLDNYWPGLYKAGHHVLLAGATQRSGKTYLGFQLLEAVPHNVSKVTFCMKPRDKTVAGWSDKLGFKEVDNWPPAKRFWQEEPKGYTLWPKHTFDPAKDNQHLREVFQRAMLDGYKKGDHILFLDEIFGVSELGLQDELSAILSRGAGMGCSAWMCVQRGSGTQQVSLPGFIWSQPYHTFIAHSSNKADKQKYADMNGDFDPEFIHNTVSNLAPYNFLYTNATGAAAIISR